MRSDCSSENSTTGICRIRRTKFALSLKARLNLSALHAPTMLTALRVAVHVRRQRLDLIAVEACGNRR